MRSTCISNIVRYIARAGEGETGNNERRREAIEDEISAGRPAPTDRLDEQGFARRHEVSRKPVRAGLLQLTSIGPVTPRPRRASWRHRCPYPGSSRWPRRCASRKSARPRLRRVGYRPANALDGETSTSAETIVAAGEHPALTHLSRQSHLAIFQANGGGHTTRLPRSSMPFSRATPDRPASRRPRISRMMPAVSPIWRHCCRAWAGPCRPARRSTCHFQVSV